MVFSPGKSCSFLLLNFTLLMFYSDSAKCIEMDALDSGKILVSPTRLKQTPQQSPVSVTTITAQTIKELQLINIYDALKYVAGMISVDLSGNEVRANQYGTTATLPRRMQLLIDGISIARPGLTFIDWATLPISINDISIIEIIRSPSASTFGANAMMATVNIKTKDPYSISRFGASSTVGGNNLNSDGLYISGAPYKNFRYRFSATKFEDDGYDKNIKNQKRHNGQEVKRINGKMLFTPSANTSSSLFLGYFDGDLERELRFDLDGFETPSQPVTSNKNIFILSESHHAYSAQNEITFKLSYSEVDFLKTWNTCIPILTFSENLRQLHAQNPEYAAAIVTQEIPSGGSASDNALRNAVLFEILALGSDAFEATCGIFSDDLTEEKQDVEFQQTFLIPKHNFRLVYGGGATSLKTESFTFLNGEYDLKTYRFFSNLEYTANNFIFNAGALAEKEKGGVEETAFSPRVGVNYTLSNNTTVRLGFSKAERTPDLLEANLSWSYFAKNLSTPYPLDGRTEAYVYFSNQADWKLDSEKILSRELSFYTRKTFKTKKRGSINYEQDLKFFYSSLTDLISDDFNFFLYDPNNDSKVTLKGFEVDLNANIKNMLLKNIINNTNIHFNYTYIDNDGENFFEKTLDAKHSGAAYFIAHYKHNWLSSLSYYGHSEINGEAFDAWEIGLGKTLNYRAHNIVIKGKVVYRPDKINSIKTDGFSTVYNINDNSSLYFITLDYTYK